MKVFIFFIVFLFQNLVLASRIDRIPKAGATLALYHSRLSQYLILLKEQTVITDLENNCLQLIHSFWRPVAGENDIRLCAQSKQVSENEIRETLEIYIDDHFLQRIIFIQKGRGIKAASIESLFELGFRIKGEEGEYFSQGLTEVNFHYKKTETGEVFHLYYPPANYRLDFFVEKIDHLVRRARYNISCSFCSGVEWIEVREIERSNLPLSIQYFDSVSPTEVTPRRFDEVMGSLFYRSLSGLGSALQSSLVREGGLPEIRF